MERLLILGAGGYGRTVAEAAAEQFEDIAFLDDGIWAAACGQEQTPTPLAPPRVAGPGEGWPVLGPCEVYTALAGQCTWAYAAFGDNALRAVWLERLVAAGFALPVLVHPRAWVSRTAQLGPGTVVLAQAAVGAGARLGPGALVNIGAIADHDCQVGACAHLAPGAIVKAGGVVAPGAKVEAGAVVARETAR